MLGGAGGCPNKAAGHRLIMTLLLLLLAAAGGQSWVF
jgi:hypothetical protein